MVINPIKEKLAFQQSYHEPQRVGMIVDRLKKALKQAGIVHNTKPQQSNYIPTVTYHKTNAQ